MKSSRGRPTTSRSTASAAEAARYCLRLLSCRDRSEAELRHRLAQRGFEEDIISAAIERLAQARLIDDAATARVFARYAFEQKKLGFAGAQQFLRQKGIPRRIVDEVLSYDEDRESEAIGTILNGRLGDTPGSVMPDTLRRIRALLMRRGFRAEAIRRALKRYMQNEEDE